MKKRVILLAAAVLSISALPVFAEPHGLYSGEPNTAVGAGNNKAYKSPGNGEVGAENGAVGQNASPYAGSTEDAGGAYSGARDIENNPTNAAENASTIPGHATNAGGQNFVGAAVPDAPTAATPQPGSESRTAQQESADGANVNGSAFIDNSASRPMVYQMSKPVGNGAIKPGPNERYYTPNNTNDRSTPADQQSKATSAGHAEK